MATTAELEQVLKAGIAAYKVGEYEQAITQLSQLLRSRAYRLKAGMGLVRVYMAQQNWSEAKKLCQKIGKSPKPSVQQWSQETLAKIERKTATQLTGDTAFANPPLHSPSHSPPHSGSGFEPLPAEAQPGHRHKPPQPLSHTSSKAAKPIEKSPAKQRSVRTDSAKSPDSKGKLAQPTQTNPQSIFHYAYLNQETSDEPILQQGVSSAESPQLADCEWTYAGRLKQGRSLGKIKAGQLWVAQTIGAVGFYFLARFLLNRAIALLNGYLIFLSGLPLLGWSRPLPVKDITWFLLGCLGLIAIASPWLWDIWLRITAKRQLFSLNALRPRSAEAATVISQRCRQRRWPIPKLWKLPTDQPLIFSYGWLPRTARLVVSEGLLTQLEDDEIAALVAYEMSQWKRTSWPILSTIGLVLQIFHHSYWRLSLWGNRQSKLLSLTAGLFATLSYCVFWLLQIPGLWIARVRTYYGDRTACEITGNPNGLIRALAKLSFGLAQSVEQQGYTPAIVESSGLLMPVAPDLARYRLYGNFSLGSLYGWDSLNPVRGWMSLPDTHPPLGDRIALLNAYAQHWKLDTEINLPTSTKQRKRKQGLSKQGWSRLVNQGTPYVGLIFGLVLGVFLLGVGAIAHQLEWPVLDWMHRDSGLFWCCILLSTGIGIILRINRFFPDLSFDMPPSKDWPHWLTESELLPVESIPTQLSGTLIGRPGLANWLGQDLLLKTSEGLLKLHFFSAIGPMGNFLRLGERPAVPLGKSVQLLGWFRRGTRPWIDVDKIRLGNGFILQAAHPIFSLAIALILNGLGLWLLLQSG